MKVYNTQEEFLKDCKDGFFSYTGDIKLNFNLTERINISARDITAWNISAGNIDAWDIDAWDIDARNISARDIDAGDINYYAVCFSYNSILCKSIAGRRENCKHFCLDGEIKIKELLNK